MFEGSLILREGQTAWVPPVEGRRWTGDDGSSPPPVAAFLEEHQALAVLPELEMNEVYTLETLLLLTEGDMLSSFTPETAAKLAGILSKVGPGAQHPQQAAPLLLAMVPQPQVVTTPAFTEMVQQYVEERERARRVKDYAKADAIREQLRKQGIKLNDDARSWLHSNGALGGTWGRHDVKVR